MDPTEHSRVWSGGHTMALEEVVRYAVGETG
jgi:hypothetical protein